MAGFQHCHVEAKYFAFVYAVRGIVLNVSLDIESNLVASFIVRHHQSARFIVVKLSREAAEELQVPTFRVFRVFRG